MLIFLEIIKVEPKGFPKMLWICIQGIGIKGKKMAHGLAWESQSHCFADKKPSTHSFGTDPQHDYSQGNCETMLSIIIKLEWRLVYCKL